jgi:hypothetical protein
VGDYRYGSTSSAGVAASSLDRDLMPSMPGDDFELLGPAM